jgi:hypothetical protein
MQSAKARLFVCAIVIGGVFAGDAFAGERKLDSPKAFADAASALHQARFQNAIDKFGVSRIGLAGHNGVMRPNTETPQERRILQSLKASKYPCVVGFYSVLRKPAGSAAAPPSRAMPQPFQPTYTTLGALTGSAEAIAETAATKSKPRKGKAQTSPPPNPKVEWHKRYSASVDALCSVALPSLMHGEAVNGSSGKWFIAMRPVRASDKKCLSCHTNSKVGDTLGVLVYSVRSSPERR